MPVSQFDQINVVVLTNMKAFTRQWILTGPLRRKSDVCLAAKQFCSATLLLLHILKSEWKPTCQQSNYAASRWLCWGKVILLRLQVLWSLITHRGLVPTCLQCTAFALLFCVFDTIAVLWLCRWYASSLVLCAVFAFLSGGLSSSLSDLIFHAFVFWHKHGDVFMLLIWAVVKYEYAGGFFFQLKPVGCLIVSGVFAYLALNISGRGCDYSSARGRCKRDTPVRPFFSVMLASW